MSEAVDYAAAVWAHVPRTLGSSSSGFLHSAEAVAYAAAVWAHVPRTLTTGGPTTLRAAMRKLLADAPAVAAMVGPRIEFGAVKQGSPYPYLVLHVPSRVGGRDLDGPDETSEARIRVDCWSDDAVEAEVLATAVREALDGFAGLVGAVEVKDIEYLREYDLSEFTGDGSDGGTTRIVVDFTVDHRF